MNTSDDVANAIRHEEEQANDETATKQTMNSTTNNDNDEEQTNNYHVLPGMIGTAIAHEDYGVHHSGGYLVRRLDDGTISVHRAIDHASTRSDLSEIGEHVVDMGEYVVTGEEYVEIPAPEGGWESETDAIPESIWEGYR